MEGNALEPKLNSDPSELQSKPTTLEPAEQRGKVLAIAVLGGLLAIPFYLESAQLEPSDITSGLGGSDVLGFALQPVGITIMGWLRLLLWSFLLGAAYRGRGWARMTVAMIAGIRGTFAVYHAVASGLQSGLAMLFLLVGCGYWLGAILLLRSPDLVTYLTRERSRS